MTSFSAAFKTMFARKRRSLWPLLWISLLATLITALISAWNMRGSQGWVFGVRLNAFANFSNLLFVYFGIWSGLALLAFLVISIRQNEHMNRSATWRLLPLSTSKFYASNLLSAFVAYLVLGLVQAAIDFVFLIPVLTSKVFRSDTKTALGQLFSSQLWSHFNPMMVLGAIVFLLLVMVLIYSGCSLIDLGSRSLAAYLPPAGAKFGQFVISLLGIIVLLWLFNYVMGAAQRWLLIMVHGDSELWLNNLLLLIFDSAFFLLDSWLLDKFVEAE